MRNLMNGLLRGSRPALVLAVLVAVVGATGTAYAGHGKGGKNGGNSGNDNGSVTSTPTTVDTTQTAQSGSSHGDSSDNGDSSDRSGKNHWKHRKTHKGHRGHAGTDYGVATVDVSRGGQPATAWATYSTALGSPVGDNTGGVFRFTCSTANAPCTVAVKAAVLSDDPGTASFYPRVLIYRQDYVNPQSESYCEYGDGSGDPAGAVTLTQQALSSTPTYAAVPINIGGTADCGGPVPTAGSVNVITVGAGYYDVHSTFSFVQ